MTYPAAAWERAVTVQEVMLKALSGEVHWFERRRFWAGRPARCGGGGSGLRRTGTAAYSIAVAGPVDVINALNDTAEESLASNNVVSPNFLQPTVFMDPRRAVLSVKLNLGR